MYLTSSTYFTNFLLFLLYHLFTIATASLPQPPPRGPYPQGTLGKRIPSYAPPRPWNDELCQSSLYPDVQLTVSFGDRLSLTRQHIVLASAKANTKVLLDGGYGSYPIPAARTDCIVGWDPDRWTMIYASPYRKYPLSRNVFTWAQAAAAVGLLERCGIAKGRTEEMWAEVFTAGNMVGKRKWDWGLQRGGKTVRGQIDGWELFLGEELAVELWKW
ncbi:MAG: hypothetical protein Q9184_005757 [Pyrenodesmia sp. 2 TL-2023]